MNYKSIIAILFVLASGLTNLYAQPLFETVVPSGSLVVGEPFRIQYVVKGAKQVEQFKVPAYTNFRIISGPDVYKGSTVGKNGLVYLTNIVVTLSPLQPGRWVVNGATANIDGQRKQSNDVFVNVVLRNDDTLGAAGQAYDDDPASDIFDGNEEEAMARIRENLFLRVSVDKRTCFVGEPVVAEYKLYSRLESRSEIVKNPGFYGFGVHDIIGLDDRISYTEVIDGKPFDVHVIRKVQLYPLQAGNFSVDAMELDNAVTFQLPDATSQYDPQIYEQMYGQQAPRPLSQTYDLVLRTLPVSISVKPLPAAGKDAFFNGAVGRFTIQAHVDETTLKQNQESRLLVTVKGQGNFSQVGVPEINWPAELESFEPSATEDYNRQGVPLKGSKTFSFPFVGNKAGQFTIGPLRFTYFNPGTNSYSTVETKPVSITITDERVDSKGFPVIDRRLPEGKKFPKALLIGFLLIAAVAAWFFYFRKKKKTQPVISVFEKESHLPIQQFLQPARLAAEKNEQQFFMQLKDGIWMFFADRISLTGSQQHKDLLREKLLVKGVDAALITDIINLLNECEWRIYTAAPQATDQAFLLSQAETFMQKIDLVINA